MIEIEITMTEAQARKLRWSAWQKRLSLGAYIVAIHGAVLEAEALAREGQQSTLGSVLERTDFVAWDLAVNHDEYYVMGLEEEMEESWGMRPYPAPDDETAR